MQLVSPSRVVRKAMGLEADGLPIKHEDVCCMCGQHLAVGDLAYKASFSAGFTDDLSLAKRGGKALMICGDCTPLTTVDGLRNSGFGAFGTDGAKPFRKWVDVASALLNPPQTPFVMCYATAKSQHMAWRSPVNYSHDAFYVRVGLRNLLVRRQRLLDAPAICERVSKAVFAPKDGTAPKKTPEVKSKTLPHPFVSLSSDLKELEHGVLRPRVYALEAQETPPYPEFHADLKWLRTLTTGETWALRFVLTPGAGSSAESE